MDLGCGTGLGGLALKPFCDNLEGIDLSRLMINKAQKKDIYDKLTQADITDYLRTEELYFDTYVSTDVFIYLGELSNVFKLIKQRNKKPGKLIFSTEHKSEGRFHLEKSGRYSHSLHYITELCQTFDYSINHFSECKLRKEKNEYILGGLYILDF